MFQRLERWWSNKKARDQTRLQARLEQVRKHNPAPVFWLFGKTQSGKTSLVKFLTGADVAEIGHGFQPCTRFSRYYEFPNAEAPVLRFLDTRGVDEPGYDPAEDIAQFGASAHVVIVTVKALDHAQENVVRHLQAVRQSNPTRPILLVLTCLHEAYPQQQHVQPYPFQATPPMQPLAFPNAASQLANLLRSLEEQRRRFAEIVDFVVPIDLTKVEEGITQTEYGGPVLQEVLLRLLPEAQRQTLQTLETGIADVKDLHARPALPTIIGYSVLAGTAVAIPLPLTSLLVLPGIQRRMIMALAQLYGRPLTGNQFVEVAEKLGIGSLHDRMLREWKKLLPSLSWLTAVSAASTSTYAIGKAFCHYDALVSHGGIPDPAELRQYYDEQLGMAKKAWNAGHE